MEYRDGSFDDPLKTNKVVDAGLGAEPLVPRDTLSSQLVPAPQVGKFDSENGRLQGVQTRVAADGAVEVLAGVAAMTAQTADLFAEVGVVCADETAIAPGAKILAREKGETAKISHGAGLATVQRRSNGLGCIFDDRDVPLPGDRADAHHVGGYAEQVHWDDGSSPCGDRCLDTLWVDVEAVWLDIYEHRSGTKTTDGTSGSEECKRGGDDLIAWTDAERPQRQQECVGTRGAAHSAGYVQKQRDLALEAGDLLAADKALTLDDRLHRLRDLRGKALVLKAEVEEGNGHVDQRFSVKPALPPESRVHSRPPRTHRSAAPASSGWVRHPP